MLWNPDRSRLQEEGCLGLLPIAGTKTYLGGKGFTAAYGLESLAEGTRGRDSRYQPRGRNWSKYHWKHCSVACYTFLAQPAFQYNWGPPARNVNAHKGPALPTSVKKKPTDWSTDQTNGGNSSNDDSNLCQLDQKSKQPATKGCLWLTVQEM